MIAALALLLCAQAPDAPADAALDEATQLYRDTEYELAGERFEAIATSPARSLGARARARMYVGLSQAGMGDMVAARRHLAAALALDETVALPPRAPPPIVAMFNELRAAVPSIEPLAAPPPAAAPPWTAPPPPEQLPLGTLGIGGLVSVGVGTVFLVAAGALGAMAAEAHARAQNKDTFSTDAQAALETANAGLAGVALFASLGVVLAAGGVVLVVVGGD